MSKSATTLVHADKTERIGQKLLAENDVYRIIGDRLFAQLNEAE